MTFGSLTFSNVNNLLDKTLDKICSQLQTSTKQQCFGKHLCSS